MHAFAMFDMTLFLKIFLFLSRIYEVITDREGNNDKELSVQAGELVEILDDRRNWWRLRNFYGNIGHAPHTILQSFEFDISKNQNNEKIGYF
jgi:hypothetical protein